MRKVLLVLCLFFIVSTAVGQVVSIPDRNLRAKIEEGLGKASGATITVADMAGLTELEADNANISDLTGLEHATNLTRLSLSNNSIIDISAVRGLTNLTELSLSNNSIIDISAVRGLTNLVSLGLSNNSISDISAVRELTNLTTLGLWSNSIIDISAVRGLTNLTALWLRDNNISDLSPLVNNTGLGSGDTVDVRENPLNVTSHSTHIPPLQRRGVTVHFDAVVAQPVNIPDRYLRAAIERALGKASGATITAVDMAGLTELERPNVRISDLTGLEHAINLVELSLRGSDTIDLSVLSGLTNLTDLNLSGSDITDLSALSGLTNLTDLNLRYNDITDLSALSGLTNLEFLNLSYTSISDISAVRGLTNLTYLNLWDNDIIDISALSGLTNLESLEFGHNSISDISSLSGLTKLDYLSLGGNIISDISALSGLTKLTELSLRGNIISDISALSGLTNLTRLYLANNNIIDISVLSGLTKLTELYLGIWQSSSSSRRKSNAIIDISALSGLTNLTRLRLERNNIIDISALSGLTKLTYLSLEDNRISDISALVNNRGFGRGDAVRVKNNPLSATAHSTHIPALQGRGVNITFDAPDAPDAHGDTRFSATRITIGSSTSGDLSSGDVDYFLVTVNSSGTLITYTTGNTDTVGVLDENTGDGRRGRDDDSGDGVNFRFSWSVNSGAYYIRVTGFNGTATGSYTLHVTFEAETADYIYWTDPVRGKIQRANLDGSNVVDLVTRLQSPQGIALNKAAEKIYWTDAGTDKIQRANLDGSNVEDLVTGLGDPNGISMDWIDQKIYWTDSGTGKIQRANLDGSNVEDLITGLSVPNGIFVFPTSPLIGYASVFDGAGKIYWTDSGTGKIQRANLDGSNVEDLVTGLNNPDGITIIPYEGGSLLWTEHSSGEMGFARLDGDDADTDDIGLDSPDGVLFHATDFIYVTDEATDSIYRASIWDDGFEPIVTGLGGVEYMTSSVNVMESFVPYRLSGRADVNDDRTIDVQDFVFVAERYGKTEASNADVNADGVVDIDDLILVAAVIEVASAAPAARAEVVNRFSVAEVEGWLTEAKLLNDGSAVYQKGIMVLEQLLAMLTPKETALLANYPNPFNPETWIPYHLARDADVSLTIYDIDGGVVRRLDLGYQQAGYYTDRAQAVYWDGRNDLGESVASGVYFYQFSAGDYSAMRKMVILK